MKKSRISLSFRTVAELFPILRSLTRADKLKVMQFLLSELATEEEPTSDRQNFLAVLGVALAGVIQVSSSDGPFTYWNVIIGIVLCLVLLNYSTSRYASKIERVALAFTWGLIIISGAGLAFQELYRWAHDTWWKRLPDFLTNGEAPSAYYFMLWLITSTIAWLIINRRWHLSQN